MSGGLRTLRQVVPTLACAACAALPLALLLGACSSIGPTVIPRDRSEYLSALADSWKEQTLLNVVRIRYGDAPSFLDVSSVVSSYIVQGQASAGAAANSDLTSAVPRHSASIGASVTYQDRPTISYTPMSGDKFAKSLLRPIPPSAIFQLIQAGYPADFVLQVTVRSLNGITNRLTSASQSHPADPRFYPLLDALRRLQQSGAVSLRLEKRRGEETGILILSPRRGAQVDLDLAFLRDTLHIRPDSDGEVVMVFGAVPRSPKELAVLSRSMAEILIELAIGIDVPQEHVSQGRTVAAGRLSSAEDRRDRPLVVIHSGPNAPSDAFSAVRYRGTWYWIDDRDFYSKRIFTLLMNFFSLAETGVTPQAPALTIPVN